MSKNHMVKQAEYSKREATENIERKLNILTAWIKNGIPTVVSATGHRLIDADDLPVLDFFPKSLRQFKAWDGSQNCEATKAALPELRSTANDTLAKRPELQNRASHFISALKAQTRQGAKDNTRDIILRLKEELEKLQLLLSARMAEVREQRIEILRLNRVNGLLELKNVGDGTEYKHVLAKLISENEKLRKNITNTKRKALDLRPPAG